MENLKSSPSLVMVLLELLLSLAFWIWLVSLPHVCHVLRSQPPFPSYVSSMTRAQHAYYPLLTLRRHRSQSQKAITGFTGSAPPKCNRECVNLGVGRFGGMYILIVCLLFFLLLVFLYFSFCFLKSY